MRIGLNVLNRPNFGISKPSSEGPIEEALLALLKQRLGLPKGTDDSRAETLRNMLDKLRGSTDPADVQKAENIQAKLDEEA